MTWQEYIHPTHHRYVEASIAWYKARGIVLEWNTQTNRWRIAGGTIEYTTLYAVDLATRERREAAKA